MKPLPLSATSAPSASFQFAVPIGLQLSRLVPSNSVTQPASAWAATLSVLASARPAPPIENNPALSTSRRFMAIFSPTDFFLLDAQAPPVAPGLTLPPPARPVPCLGGRL